MLVCGGGDGSLVGGVLECVGRGGVGEEAGVVGSKVGELEVVIGGGGGACGEADGGGVAGWAGAGEGGGADGWVVCGVGRVAEVLEGTHGGDLGEVR